MRARCDPKRCGKCRREGRERNRLVRSSSGELLWVNAAGVRIQITEAVSMASPLAFDMMTESG